MTLTPPNLGKQPIPNIAKLETQQNKVSLTGNWTLANLVQQPDLRTKIRQLSSQPGLSWDLRGITVLDNFSALLIARAWQQTLPTNLEIKPEHLKVIQKWQHQTLPKAFDNNFTYFKTISYLYSLISDIIGQLVNFIAMLGQLLFDAGHLLLHPGDIPWSETSITVYEAGVRALGITALVGFLIGIVLSYLSALQLKLFGAEIYIIDILGLSVIRELGPLLAAILVAGRSGSAMTAQIGIMRVTEELDALSAMGIAHSLRLVLPKVAALMMAMPLLSVWTSAAALLGGMFSAQNTLDISYQQFFYKLPDVVPIVNLYIGLGKSAVFGLMIALIACHFGFRIQPNTESLGSETTNSVVAAITVVIMVDALFAILFMDVGMP